MKKNKRTMRRLRIKKALRAKVRGTNERPRLSVFRSNSHIYAQVINDEEGRTLAAASSLESELSDKVGGKRPVDASGAVGELVAQRAKEAGISQVVFDRNGYLYHGRVKALAEGARKGGLEF